MPNPCFAPKLLRAFFLVCLALVVGLGRAAAQTTASEAVWEPEIRHFEALDRTNPPPQNAILFVGSSSIRKWTTLAADFPDFKVINRGFGGSQIADSTYFASRIIIPYHPHLILFYAGDNDLGAGKTPDQVVTEYQDFVRTIHQALPQTTIAFISIKPSLLRWKLKDKMVETNRRIAEMKEDRLVFIDVYSHMLGQDGTPEKDLFVADGLHMTPKGYRLWTSIIRPYLN